MFFSDPEPVPVSKPPPAEIKEDTKFILKILAPVLKQTKEMQMLFTYFFKMYKSIFQLRLMEVLPNILIFSSLVTQCWRTFIFKL